MFEYKNKYIQYINQHMQAIKYNKIQFIVGIKFCMFWRWTSIFRDSPETDVQVQHVNPTPISSI